MVKRFVEWTMRRGLKKAFRRVAWAGPVPVAEQGVGRDTPLVLYGNHHSFYDGQLHWLMLQALLGRPATLWMEDWDRVPLFAAVGAQPFPLAETPAARRRRAATVRRTVRGLRGAPQRAFVYFPEGRLHPPAEGLLPFPEGAFERLARLFPEDTRWWPVATRLVATGHARPTMLLGGPRLHAAPDGRERKRLRAAMEHLAHTKPRQATHTLLDGARDPGGSGLSMLRPLFERYL